MNPQKWLLNLFDTIYVKRRTGINREVYFCKNERSNLDEFIRDNEEKIKNLKNKIEKESGIIFETKEI